jgi:hypothetical protein
MPVVRDLPNTDGGNAAVGPSGRIPGAGVASDGDGVGARKEIGAESLGFDASERFSR